MNEPSIFTKIINGDIPCHKVYEDDSTFAFMDIEPIQPGMVLVIPKEQIDNFEDMSDDLVCDVMLTAKKIMKALRRVYPNKKKIGVQIEGLEVPHTHIKLIPIDTGAECHARPNKDIDNAELAELAEKIKENIE